MSHKSEAPSANEIWRILKETNQRIKETNQQIKETDRHIKAMSIEADKRYKETQNQFKETDKRLNKAISNFDGQWGQLVESLVEGKLVELLVACKIQVTRTSTRVKSSYKDKNNDIQQKEFDIIASNGKEVVVVEVKTTLSPSKVKYFIEGLKDFKKYLPHHKNRRVYGAVAYLRSKAESEVFAEKQGLFVIRATGDSASIINKKGFKPKNFS